MLVGLGATVLVQTTRSPEPMKTEFGKVVTSGTMTEVTGGAKFVINGIEVTADEATIDNRTKEVKLHGNVKMKLPRY